MFKMKYIWNGVFAKFIIPYRNASGVIKGICFPLVDGFVQSVTTVNNTTYMQSKVITHCTADKSELSIY